MAKKVKIAKGTLSVIEATSDALKPRKDGSYKIKFKKKKDRRKLKENCIHWVKKKKIIPPVTSSDAKPGYWKCLVCGELIPIKPNDEQTNANINQAFREQLNQIMLYSVKLGGDDDSTKLLLTMRKGLIKFEKLQKNVLKAMRKREAAQSKAKTNGADSFNVYQSYNYRN
jgi:hypothetical protein